MDLRRLRAGDWITTAAGAALLVSLFLPWYGEGGGETLTAWQALTISDVVLALVGLVAVALLVVTATQPVPAVPLALACLVTLLGTVATIVVLARVGSLPGDADSREWGLWLGLAAALGVAAGGLISMRDERLSRPGETTDLSGRPVAEQPEVEVVPPPDPRGAHS